MNSRFTPCLLFGGQAEEAARYYVSVFPNSRIVEISYYPDAGYEVHRQKAGTVLTVSFELDGTRFTALNGGPDVRFTEAISLQIECADQAEVDYFWDRLSEGGDPEAQQCGWVRDRFGLFWQVIPRGFVELVTSPDPDIRRKAFAAMLGMKKLDLAALRQTCGV